jgi:hypothetical protein
MPDTFPYWQELVEDGAANLWILSGGEGGRRARLDVFDRGGRFLGSVPSPLSSLAKTSWTADHVAVIEVDEHDLPVVRIYRIVKGKT